MRALKGASLSGLCETNRNTCRCERSLRIRDAGFAEMEDRGRQHGAGMAFGNALDQIVQRTDAARGDHRHMHRIADGAGERDVVAGFGAVAVF